MNTTTTTTTTSISTSSSKPNDENVDTCPEIKDYENLRAENFQKIDTYYRDLLKKYTDAYTEYASNAESINDNDKTYATTILSPKVAAINNQIITLTQKLIDNVNTDTDLILEQKNELDKKNSVIDNLISTNDQIKKQLKEANTSSQSRNDNYNSLKGVVEDIEFKNNLFIGGNILLLMTIIGLIIYNVYK